MKSPPRFTAAIDSIALCEIFKIGLEKIFKNQYFAFKILTFNAVDADSVGGKDKNFFLLENIARLRDFSKRGYN